MAENNTCYKCDIEIDEQDTICCNCIDDTDGRNQHFWQIKKETNIGEGIGRK